MSNLKLDDVFSNGFGKSSRSIIEQILAHPREIFDVTPFVDKRCKTPIEEIQAAIDGSISSEQAVKLCQCLDHIDELEMHIKTVEQEILRLPDPYESALNLIRTFPGFDKNPMTAIQVLSEIGGDMSVFPTAKHLISWTGCCPRNDQSNKKIKSKKHPEFTNCYRRIKARRGHKKATIALCHMILTSIWHTLTDLKPYTPDGFLESHPVNEAKTLTTSQALNLLRQHRYIIKDKFLSVC